VTGAEELHRAPDGGGVAEQRGVGEETSWSIGGTASVSTWT